MATGAVTQLTNDSRYDSWWAKASPDQTQMLFYRTPNGVHDSDYSKTSLWMANIDGSAPHQVIATGQYGWTVQAHAEWSPDGTRLVMFAFPMGIVVTDTNGVLLHHVAYGVDPSWSSDGRRIIYIDCADPASFGCTPDQGRVHVVNEDGTSPHILVSAPVQANDPTMSPDGSQIAWETDAGGNVWDLWVANADGSNPHVLLSDGNINTNPVWASDQELVLYKNAPLLRLGFAAWSMRSDGSGLTWITGGPLGSFVEMPFPLR
jgi:TolB protein